MKRSDFKDLDVTPFFEKVKFFGEHRTCSWHENKPPEWYNKHWLLSDMQPSVSYKTERFTLHKNKDITLYTDHGVIKFWHNYREELIEIELQ